MTTSQEKFMEDCRIIHQFIFDPQYEQILFLNGKSFITCLNSLIFEYSINQNNNQLKVGSLIDLREFLKEDATEDQKKFVDLCKNRMSIVNKIGDVVFKFQLLNFMQSKGAVELHMYFEVLENNSIVLFKDAIKAMEDAQDQIDKAKNEQENKKD